MVKKKLQPHYINHSIANNYTELVAGIESYLQEAKDTLVDSRNTVKIVSYKQQQFVVKSFRKPTLFMRFAYVYFRPSKAKRSFLYAQKLLQHTIATPKPIAYREDFTYGVLTHSYYISEYLPHEKLIFDLFNECDKNLHIHVKTLKQFAAFTYKLHSHNIFHNDYTSKNILLLPLTEGYQFALVDLNRLRFRKRSILGKAKNISSVWGNFAVLDLIATEYAGLAGYNPDILIKLVHFWKAIGHWKGALKNRRNQLRSAIKRFAKNIF